MHCLYCNQPLALLRRLTGDGEFCSKDHKKAYQRESNQLALARLLAANPAPSHPDKSGFADKAASKLASKKVEAPAPPKPVIAVPPAERIPATAGFLSEYPREAASVSGLARSSGDPRFGGAPPARKPASIEGALSAQPRVAVFEIEPLQPRTFAFAVRIPQATGFHPDKSGFADKPASKKVEAPALPRPVAAMPPAERIPATAGFLSENPCEAATVSGVVRLSGNPRFAGAPPARKPASIEGALLAQPRVALFEAEPLQPRTFALGVRNPKATGFRPPTATLRLEEASSVNDAAPIAPQPSAAAFLTLPPPERVISSGTVLPPAGPKFRMEAVSRFIAVARGRVASGAAPREASFLSESARSPTPLGLIRRAAIAPRWKALQSALPPPAPGRIVFVLGPFLCRPVRTAGISGSLDAFELPQRPVSFPSFPLGMSCLDQRMHRTDRIGFSPP